MVSVSFEYLNAENAEQALKLFQIKVKIFDFHISVTYNCLVLWSYLRELATGLVGDPVMALNRARLLGQGIILR